VHDFSLGDAILALDAVIASRALSALIGLILAALVLELASIAVILAGLWGIIWR